MITKIKIPEEQLNRYIIGEHPIEKIDEAVKREYKFNISPKISKEKSHGKLFGMEQYAISMAMYSVKKYNIGRIDKSPDGCSSDIIYSQNGNYIGIQVKTTSKMKSNLQVNGNTTYGWAFKGTNKNYQGLLLFMKSISDNKNWLIPFSLIKEKYKSESLLISLNKNKSKIKWAQFEVTNQNLGRKLDEYYKLLITIPKNPLLGDLEFKSLDSLKIPKSFSHQREHENRNKIIPILEKTGLNISSPPLENMQYDVILGNLRIQEKTGIKSKGGFNVNFGKKYNNLSFDILLIHLPFPYYNMFYFIPMDKLLEYNYISGKEIQGKESFNVYPDDLIKMKINQPKNKWTNEFLFYYEDPNIGKRLNIICKNQLSHDMSHKKIKDCISWNIKCENFNQLTTVWELERTYPSENVNYDFLLFGRRIVERILTINDKSFRLLLNKYFENKKIPYTQGEFDYVYCIFPIEYKESKEYFYLVPMCEFLKAKVLKTDECVGKERINIPPPGTEMRINKQSNNWINKFIYHYDDIEIKNKIIKLFMSHV